MKVEQLIEILNKYPKDTDIKVLEKLRTNGAGSLANIIGIQENIDQDTNKVSLYIETDNERHMLGYEREEDYK